MHARSWMKFGALVVVLSAALVVQAIAATPDAWITTKTKLALLTSEGVSGTSIHVDTIVGKVTLHGKVRSADEKAKAETITRKIDGVTGVRNLLQVVAEEQEDAVKVADDALEERITKTLEADPALESSSISVKSVDKGLVLLSGEARTLTAHLRAIERAAGVPGVRRVASEVKSPDALADTEIWKDPEPKQPKKPKKAKEPKEPSEDYGVKDAASDMWTTSATKMSLIADRRTPALEINVDSNEGVVTLFGIVPSAEAKAAAEETALGVRGVKSVENDLEVVASPEREAVDVSDEDLEREVNEALEPRDFGDLTIEVKNSVVRLSGTVPTGARRLEAAVAARAVAGVHAVKHDDLQIAPVETDKKSD